MFVFVTLKENFRENSINYSLRYTHKEIFNGPAVRVMPSPDLMFPSTTVFREQIPGYGGDFSPSSFFFCVVSSFFIVSLLHLFAR